MQKSILKILFVSALIIFISCNKADPVCPDSDKRTYDFKLAFSRIKDSTTTQLKIYHPDLDTINTENKFPELLSIPVDMNSNVTEFYIDFINDSTKTTTTDTITFTYEKNIYLNYRECGFIMDFIIDSIYGTSNNLDSAKIVNKYINEENELNLEIFY